MQTIAHRFGLDARGFVAKRELSGLIEVGQSSGGKPEANALQAAIHFRPARSPETDNAEPTLSNELESCA